ncbi:MAG: hypothetical protein AAGF12_29760 [Myxococcota bacterium]
MVSGGGDIDVLEGGVIGGEVLSFGGTVTYGGKGSGGEGAHDAPAEEAGFFARFFSDLFSGLLNYGLLFLLGLVLMGVTRARFDGVQVAMVRDPLRSGATGLLGIVGGLFAIAALAITIIGIPVAVVMGLALPLCVYVGMAAAARVIGAGLPVERLKGKAVLQLAAGTAILFALSLIPYLGSALVFIAAVVGFGAVLRTKYRPVEELAFENSAT